MDLYAALPIRGSCYTGRMDRSRLRTRLRKLADQGLEDDLAGTTPAERIAMVWPMTLDAWAFLGDPGAESRLQRHVVRVVRRES